MEESISRIGFVSAPSESLSCVFFQLHPSMVKGGALWYSSKQCIPHIRKTEPDLGTLFYYSNLGSKSKASVMIKASVWKRVGKAVGGLTSVMWSGLLSSSRVNLNWNLNEETENRKVHRKQLNDICPRRSFWSATGLHSSRRRSFSLQKLLEKLGK